MSVQYLLRPVAWEIRTRSSLCHDIFIVTALLLLPIRTLHLRPPPSGCLQRVDPFTVAPPAAAPESFTPSVGFDKVKSLPFSCKLHLEIVDSTISCKNTNCKEVFPVFLHLCKKIGRKKWFIRNAYKRKQVYENIGRRIKLSNSEKNIKSVKMPWCFGNFERN